MAEPLGPRHYGHHGSCTLEGEHYHEEERPPRISLEMPADEAQGLLEELQDVLEAYSGAPRLLAARNALARLLLEETGSATVEAPVAE